MTTDLDAAQPSIWNIGAIPAGSNSGTRELITKILVASAAIPGVVQSIMFDIEVDSEHLTEPYKGRIGPGCMENLLQYGFDRGRSGQEWQSAPPFWRK